MKICLISPQYFPDETGIANGSRMLAHALAKEPGVEGVEVLAKRNPGQGESDGGTVTVTVHRLFSRFDGEGLKSLVQQVATENPDVVQIEFQQSVYDFHPMLLSLPAAIRKAAPKTRVFLRMHDLIVPQKVSKWRRWLAGYRWPLSFSGPKTAGYRLLAKMLERVDGVTACKMPDLEGLEGRVFPLMNGSLRPGLRFIPIGLDIPVHPFSPLEILERREHLGGGEKDAVIVYFGFLQEGKGGDDALTVFDKVADRHPEARLLVLGATAPWNPSLAMRYPSLLKNLRYRDRVIWKENYLSTEEVSTWLQCADIALLPFRFGAVLNSGTLLACLYHGLPVVTTEGRSPLGGPFKDGENIFLAKAGDLDELAEKVCALIENPSLCDRLRKGAKEASSFFDWSRIAKSHMDFYREG